MSRFIDMLGETVGELTVLKYAGRGRHGSMWECRCSCGAVRVVRGTSLRGRSRVTSCGCKRYSGDAKNGGGCSKCLPGVPSPGFRLCDECRRRSRECVSKSRVRAREMGLCIMCRCRAPRDGLSCCDSCIGNELRSGWCVECMSAVHRADCSQRRTA